MAIVSFCSLLFSLTSPAAVEAGRLKCEKQWRRLWFIWYLDDQLQLVASVVWWYLCGVWLSWARYLSVEKGQWNEKGEGLQVGWGRGATLVAVTFILARIYDILS
jgi:hypothetical protein